jgi:Tfp pilus assembly protein PilF
LGITRAANLERAQQLLKEKRFSDVLQTLKAFPLLEWGSEEHLVAGWAHYALNQDREAHNSFEIVLKENPNLTDALLGSGLALLRMGRPDEAEDRLNQAARMDQKNAEVFEALGILSIRMGRPDKAREYLKESLELNPDNREASDELARLAKKSLTH